MQQRSPYLAGKALLRAGCLVAGLVACGVSSTAVREPTHRDRTYTRVLVYANFDPPRYPNLRKDVESAVVTKLKSSHIDAVAALDLGMAIPIKAGLSEAGFDCVLEIRIGADALVYTTIGGTLIELTELGERVLVPISGGTQWVQPSVWRDGVELRSVGWSVEGIILTGANRLAEDLIGSGMVATKS